MTIEVDYSEIADIGNPFERRHDELVDSILGNLIDELPGKKQRGIKRFRIKN